ncbi:MAG: nitroreductase [Cyclobacteriaceae bacterium]|jgi:nitroreductase
MYLRIFDEPMKNMKPYQKKSKDQSFELLDLIKNRFSPRAFARQPISEDHTHVLLESARWAPSSMNMQPWRFLYAYQGEKSFELMVDSLMEGNKPWAKKASLLILTMIIPVTESGEENHYALHDLGLAMGQLSIQAEALSIGIHQMGGFSKQRAIELLGLPSELIPVTINALGYYGDPSTLKEPFQSRETSVRNRLDLSQISFHQKIS